MDWPLPLIEAGSWSGTIGKKAAAIDLVLPAEAALKRDLSLPASSLSKLDEIVKLELLRNLPFSSDEILWRCAAHRDGGGGATVSIYVLKKGDLARLNDSYGEPGVSKPRVFLRTGDEILGPFDAGDSDVPSRLKEWRRVTLLLLLICFGLGAFLVAGPHFGRLQEIEQFRRDVAITQSEAVALRKTVNAKKDALAAQTAFIKEVESQTKVVDLVREFTVRLPDEAWVSQVAVEPDGVWIRATVAGSAAELSLTLSKSAYLIDPALRGAIKIAPDGQSETFEIAARAKGRQ